MARTRSEDITSFKEHRANLRSHFDRARETGRPLFVTSKGHPDAVVLSPEAYDDSRSAQPTSTACSRSRPGWPT